VKFLQLIVLMAASFAAHAATIALNPQPGYTLLGVSCGGIHTSTYVTGFDAGGNITGEVYAWTRCGGSGRGGGYKSHLYDSWHSIVWDLSGNPLATTAYDGIVPDPTLIETNAGGDTISTSQVQTSVGAAYLGILQTP
jgi:hypothetical protein